jgi:ABC-type antimicrobial peptide transport system permease subunit
MALDDGNIITWNVANWVTVVLMAAIAFAIIGVAQKAYVARKAS